MLSKKKHTLYMDGGEIQGLSINPVHKTCKINKYSYVAKITR